MKQQLAITLGQSSSAGIKDDNEDFYGAYTPREGTQLDNKGITLISMEA